VDYMPKDWIAVPGMECARTHQCDAVTKSKIQILHVSYRWSKMKTVSGNFAVEFYDGRKLEASFKAKVRRPQAKIICE